MLLPFYPGANEPSWITGWAVPVTVIGAALIIFACVLVIGKLKEQRRLRQNR